MGLGYDVRGNLNNRNGQVYQFDVGNRLRTALGTESYRYDAWGRRILTVSGGGLLYEMYSKEGPAAVAARRAAGAAVPARLAGREPGGVAAAADR